MWGGFTLKSILQKRPSSTVRSEGICRKRGAYDFSWIAEPSFPLSSVPVWRLPLQGDRHYSFITSLSMTPFGEWQHTHNKPYWNLAHISCFCPKLKDSWTFVFELFEGFEAQHLYNTVWGFRRQVGGIFISLSPNCTSIWLENRELFLTLYLYCYSHYVALLLNDIYFQYIFTILFSHLFRFLFLLWNQCHYGVGGVLKGTQWKKEGNTP